MTMIAVISAEAIDGSNATFDALQAEFGAILAERIVEAEAVDFLWETRLRERYFGQHFATGIDGEEAAEEVSRVLILASLAGRWHVAMCLVNGEGDAVDLLWKQRFGSRIEAESAFARAH